MASATHRQAVSHSAAARPFATQAPWHCSQEGAVVRLRREPAPGRERIDDPDQDRLMDEIDRQAVPAGEAHRAPRPRRRAPTLGRRQPRNDARRPRDAEADEDDAGPGQERAPVDRVRQRLAEPEPQKPEADRIASNGQGSARRSPPSPTARLTHAGAATNGAARRLATAMQWRMPKKMPSPGAKSEACERSPAPPRRR